eukprot:1300309-Alexandrium_andersonii.AAC.1
MPNKMLCPVLCPGGLCPYAVSGCVRRLAGAFGSVRELCPCPVSGVLCPAVRRRGAKWLPTQA